MAGVAEGETLADSHGPNKPGGLAAHPPSRTMRTRARRPCRAGAGFAQGPRTGSDLQRRLQPTEAVAMNAKLDQAFAHHQRGELAPAESLYREVLAQTPGHSGVLHMLGLVQHQRGRHREAADLIRTAIAIDPGQPAAHSNLALVLQELGDYGAALASCDRALALKPDYAEAHNNRGNALHRLQRDDEALASYDRALALMPHYAEAYNNRGVALCGLRRFAEAAASCDRALTMRPNYVDALSNCGNALRGLGRDEEALAFYDRALALDPRYAEALNHRTLVLLELRRVQEALETCDRLLALDPHDPDALAHRGNALYLLKRFGDAAAAFDRLLAIAPDYDYAAGTRLRSRLMCCDWANVAELTRSVESAVESGGKAVHPFAFLVNSRSSSAQLQCARTYVGDQCPPSARPLAAGGRDRRDRIRVAYLSANFHEHAVAYLAAGLFEAHDRSRFEITAISFGPAAEGGIRERIARSFDRFVDVRGDSDVEVATMLAAAGIDIAVDLTGHTTDSRPGILAHRPAPLQVNFLGYPGTFGAEYIDYIVADRFVIPTDDEAFYAEKVVRLPDTYQVNDRKRRMAEQTPTRAEAGLPETGFVFCCFNNNYKITPEIFDIWMRLLYRMEGSVLWLLEDNAAASANLRREALRRGVSEDRLVFAPRRAQDAHLARQRLADLFVDTLPYAAHTTASDALWAGLPVVTCMGTTFAGRVAGSLLHAVGLPELATRNLDDYEALALQLATTPSLLAAIRARLADNRATCPLFDTDRFRRHIESAYTAMWERHLSGLPPASFAVEAI